MDKKAIYDYLDDPSQNPKGQEERELLALLHELEEQPAAEPDQVYWNNFNARLQTRLDKGKRRPWYLAWPAWTATLLSAALLFVVFRPSEPTAALSLADLSNEGLSLISEAYEPLIEEEVEMDLADVDYDLLLEAYGTDSWAAPLDLDTSEIDVEELKALWNQEG